MNQIAIQFPEKKKKASKSEAEVLAVLREARDTKTEYIAGYPGKVPNYHLQGPGSGGSEGKRRFRLLREKGFPVDLKRLKVNGKFTGTWLYWIKEEDQDGSNQERT